jgi:hypothetical protein
MKDTFVGLLTIAAFLAIFAAVIYAGSDPHPQHQLETHADTIYAEDDRGRFNYYADQSDAAELRYYRERGD